jgi:diaminohydroxyphosphoribosylaminopyrimidine deaminase / 5-amino-6-(5-phosphoribosylamino)uracil reductase
VRRPSAEERFMRLALREARRGLGRTSPNPAVGAVLVKNGRVVGRGHHARAGDPHAEVAAIRAAGERARGADLYTTLEPCDHFGRTPPCSLAILEAGVRRVRSGSSDPNPRVNGRGIRRLRRAGVEVETGILRGECDAIIEPWARFITTGRPHVTLKVASTLDGRIATSGGDSRWVTGAASRALVHRLRDAADAVLVGAGTVRADDPRLTTRLPGGRGRDPIRVILDSRLELPHGLRLFRQRSPSPTIVAHVSGTPPGSPPRGVEYLRCKARRGRVDLADLLSRLGRRGVTTLLVEGGAEVARSLLERRQVDRILIFLAPKLALGGLSWLPGKGPARMADALPVRDMEVRRVGSDLLVIGRPAPKGARTPRVD